MDLLAEHKVLDLKNRIEADGVQAPTGAGFSPAADAGHVGEPVRRGWRGCAREQGPTGIGRGRLEPGQADGNQCRTARFGRDRLESVEIE
jgi:hypothetical protein